MNELREQLDILRARVARIDAKYTSRDHPPSPARSCKDEPQIPDGAAQRYLEDWLTGSEVETAFGRHFETEKLYARHRRHGSADIGELESLPHDLLEAVSGGTAANSSP